MAAIPAGAPRLAMIPLAHPQPIEQTVVVTMMRVSLSLRSTGDAPANLQLLPLVFPGCLSVGFAIHNRRATH